MTAFSKLSTAAFDRVVLGDDGRIHPEPVIVAGRRLWSPKQVRQAAKSISLVTDDLQAQLAREVNRG